VHHIIPRCFGGTDQKHNLVPLLPEEHLFVHKLRYKAFNTREDMLAVRFICNGLKSKGHIESYKHLRLTRNILNTYAWIRTESANFRIEHGWQSADGRKRISAARKGTMPAKDAATGEMIGSVDTQHPKVLSGDWVHHSKGTVKSIDQRLNYSSQKGSDNTNYKGFVTKEFLLGLLKEHYATVVVENHFIQKRFSDILKKCVAEQYDKKIHTVIINNRFGTKEKFIEAFNREHGTNVQYNPYYKTSEMKRLLSKKSAEYVWITNGKINKRAKAHDEIPQNWKRGRVKC